jgi:signal transduction histidine kinase
MFGPDLSYAEIFSLIAVERRHNGVAPPCNLRRPVRGGTVDVPADPAALRRRQIGHDIDHQLATIMLLASLIDTADDVGTDSRQRARQIVGEARWLERLHQAYVEPPPDRAELFRLDLVAAEVVEATRLSTATAIVLEAAESWVRTDRLACWRALRNLVGNAVRSAGPAGRVRVGVVGDGRWTVAVVDDDGPGFGEASPGSQSLGLGIAHGFAAVWDGHLEIHRGNLGGCRARLRLRAAAPGPSCAC